MRCKAYSLTEKLVRHHIKYEKYGAAQDVTIPLCEDCHNTLHRFIKGNDPDLAYFTRQFINAGKFWKEEGC